MQTISKATTSSTRFLVLMAPLRSLLPLSLLFSVEQNNWLKTFASRSPGRDICQFDYVVKASWQYYLT
jgi:hypothetical protein